jgi:hypothetical protein
MEEHNAVQYREDRSLSAALMVCWILRDLNWPTGLGAQTHQTYIIPDGMGFPTPPELGRNEEDPSVAGGGQTMGF